MKYCECGCGEQIPELTKRYKPARFKHGHNYKGKNNPMYGKRVEQTPESREKIRQSKLGEKAYNWKGDNVGYFGMHRSGSICVPDVTSIMIKDGEV